MKQFIQGGNFLLNYFVSRFGLPRSQESLWLFCTVHKILKLVRYVDDQTFAQ